MPSFGGFHIPPAAWTDWVLAQGPRPAPGWDAPTAEEMIYDKLAKKGLLQCFGVRMVPALPTETEDARDGIMVYRRQAKKLGVYLPPRDGNVVDREAKRILQLLVGLKVSEWQSLSYNPNSCADIVYSKTVESPQK